MQTRNTTPTPELTDFHDEREVLVSFSDTTADAFGRRQFTAFWIADNVGPHLNERGVRAQVFHTHPERFADRRTHFGSTVRFLND